MGKTSCLHEEKKQGQAVHEAATERQTEKETNMPADTRKTAVEAKIKQKQTDIQTKGWPGGTNPNIKPNHFSYKNDSQIKMKD